MPVDFHLTPFSNNNAIVLSLHLANLIEAHKRWVMKRNDLVCVFIQQCQASQLNACLLWNKAAVTIPKFRFFFYICARSIEKMRTTFNRPNQLTQYCAKSKLKSKTNSNLPRSTFFVYCILSHVYKSMKYFLN